MMKKNICICFCVLPDNQDRKNNVLKNIQKLHEQDTTGNFTIKQFNACTSEDSVINMEDYISQKMLKQKQVKQYPNKIFCAISHAKIWEEFTGSGYEHLVVLEDDVIVSDSFIQDITCILAELNNYDLCFLWHHPHYKKIDTCEFVTVNKGYAIYGAIAYLISQQGAVKLVKSLPFKDNNDKHVRSLIASNKLETFISKKDLVRNLGAIDSRDRSSLMGSTIFNIPSAP